MLDKQYIDALATAIAERLMAKGIGEPRLMEVEAAATYLGMTVDALRTKVTLKQIPCVRIDRKWRFDREELNKWIAAHREVA